MAMTHKYNGKELETRNGLNLYDYGARQYAPVTGLFTSIDPLRERYYHVSPYVYCMGNPVIKNNYKIMFYQLIIGTLSK
ncbi:MAG: RHS repeat-associated core domain-containing protein [Bacteroidaceae bacterium]|nr:hypothetical protein [Prevotellaceae bacterium]MDY5632607.1 RHS repeat-associated core domain-containing protein [Bacteroidaceae bacterium]